jgi:hypothetical protein
MSLSPPLLGKAYVYNNEGRGLDPHVCCNVALPSDHTEVGRLNLRVGWKVHRNAASDCVGPDPLQIEHPREHPGNIDASSETSLLLEVSVDKCGQPWNQIPDAMYIGRFIDPSFNVFRIAVQERRISLLSSQERRRIVKPGVFVVDTNALEEGLKFQFMKRVSTLGFSCLSTMGTASSMAEWTISSTSAAKPVILRGAV